MLRKRTVRVAIAAAISIALAATMAACSTSVSSDSKGLILNTAITGGDFQDVFNPYLPTSGTQANRFMIYEPLVQVNKIKSEDYKPWLATKWDWSADSKTLTFHLREGVKWSDGKPFTSADVVYTYQMLKDNPALNLNGLEFDSVKADGDFTVVMTFAGNGRPSFPKTANTEIVPQHIYSTKGDLTKYNDPNPVGTGPFVFDKSSFSPQSYTILKNNDYWQKGKPEIGGLRVIGYKDNSAIASALLQGDVDWSSAYIANIDQTFTAKGPQFKHFWPVIGSDGLITNNAAAPFDNLAIRQATSLGINRKQVADSANRPAATSAAGLPMPLFENAIADKYKDVTYKHDVAGAKKLIEGEGYTLGSDGYYAKGGKTLGFTITIPSAYTEQVAAAQIIQANLKDVGMKVEVNGVSVDAIDPLTSKGDYDATIGYPIDEYTTVYGLYNAWMNPKYSVPVGTVDQTKQNIERWNDPQTAQFFADYENATTDDQRNAAIEGLEGRFVEGQPWLILSYYQAYADWNDTKVTGFPTDANPYWRGDPNPVVALQLKPTGK
ncbi:MAG: Peptide/nickel transport system substrate-binding protein [Microbacteriaceae bacterium]|jgi:peptide/nickel transport system substrate-binding protein|nr:Peptide/nickel transport system substrate-binding protein [Microbacteriaceae bacterium]